VNNPRRFALINCIASRSRSRSRARAETRVIYFLRRNTRLRRPEWARRFIIRDLQFHRFAVSPIDAVIYDLARARARVCGIERACRACLVSRHFEFALSANPPAIKSPPRITLKQLLAVCEILNVRLTSSEASTIFLDVGLTRNWDRNVVSR